LTSDHVSGCRESQAPPVEYPYPLLSRSLQLTYCPDMSVDDIQKQRVGFRGVFAPTTVAQYTYLLKRFGTLSLEEAVQPAIEVAEKGFTADTIYANAVKEALEELKKAGQSALLKPFVESFLPDGKPVKPG